jgi:sec-independent protein translocase protein TatA
VFIIVLIVAVVLFGGSQLPKLARNLGRAQRELQEGMAEGSKEDSDDNENKDESS